MAITDFLKTSRSKDELRMALEVSREFTKGENTEEYFSIPFSAWIKLEQFQEFLEHIIEEKELQKDTIEYMNRDRS